MWDTSCSAAFQELRASLIAAPILAFPTETGQYILDTDASNFGLGGVLSQIQDNQERVVAYCSRALRPSQRWYCTTKREMLAVVAMCIQFISYLRGTRFTLRTDHKSLVWLHRFKDTEGMLSRWLHSLQQFQFSIIRLYTGRERTMGMLMVFRALHHHHVDNARAQTAHRPVWYITTRINRSTLSRQAARRMQIWYQCSPERTG